LTTFKKLSNLYTDAKIRFGKLKKWLIFIYPNDEYMAPAQKQAIVSALIYTVVISFYFALRHSVLEEYWRALSQE
jgi:hypothetical protein